jgi:C4-dicarboxylate-specific signal transduction histidine kinase
MRKFSWSQPGFSALLLTRFLALTVVSVLAVSYFGSRTLGNRLREEAEEHLREAALRLCEGVENYLELHRMAIAGLTLTVQPEGGGVLSPAAAGRALELTQRTYPGFLMMLIADAEGRIVVASRRHNRVFIAARKDNFSVADRDYFRQPRATGKSYISGIFMPRARDNGPIVAISAPILDASGRFLGVIEGSIDITRLPPTPDAASKNQALVAQDSRGKVVFSSRPDLHKPLEQWNPYPIKGSCKASMCLLVDPAQRDVHGSVGIPEQAFRGEGGGGAVGQRRGQYATTGCNPSWIAPRCCFRS